MNIFDIKIRVHPTILLPLAMILITKNDSDGFFSIFLGFVMLFASVLLHELGHAAAAARFGMGTQSIVLHAFGGIAKMDRPIEKPMEEFVITMAGPAVNLTICLVLLLIFGPAAFLQGSSLSEVFVDLFFINLAILIFNLIPIFPMDGGRILRSILNFAFGLYPATIAVFLLSIPLAIAGAYLLFTLGSYLALLLMPLMVMAGWQEVLYLKSKTAQESS